MGEALPDGVFEGAIVGRRTRIMLGGKVDFWEAEVTWELRGFWVGRGRWGSGSWVALVLVQRQKIKTSAKMWVIPADICTESAWEEKKLVKSRGCKVNTEKKGPWAAKQKNWNA